MRGYLLRIADKTETLSSAGDLYRKARFKRGTDTQNNAVAHGPGSDRPGYLSLYNPGSCLCRFSIFG
jgi:hypothetical protein